MLPSQSLPSAQKDKESEVQGSIQQISKEPEIQIFQWDVATMILTALYTCSSE